MQEQLSADGGYFSEENIRWLIREAKVAPYIPPDKTRHGERLTSPRGPISRKMSVADRMRRKLRTKAGRAIYKLRKAIMEPVFGHIKEAMGFCQFWLRGGLERGVQALAQQVAADLLGAILEAMDQELMAQREDSLRLVGTRSRTMLTLFGADKAQALSGHPDR